MPEKDENQKQEQEESKPAQPLKILSGNTENLISEVYTGTAENTYFKSPLVSDSFRPPYNPDDIWQKTGDYSIYEEMAEDDQVSVCLQLKKDLILGSGYQILTEEDGQEEIVKDIEQGLEDDCDAPFLDSIEEIMDAYTKGFSLTEKIFKVRDNGKLGVKALKTRHPNSWLLFQDDKGNIEKYEQQTINGKLDIDPKSLIHFVNNRKYQNPYGTSDLRSCYAAWFAKRQVVRYFGIFLEKAASPIPIGKYDKNAPANTAENLLNILKKFQTKTAIAIPKDLEVQFLECKSNGEAYSKALNIFNMFIARSLFIPDLMGMSGSETSGGSHALGKEQMNVFFMHINRRRMSLEKLINKHIIWPMVVYNYGFIENFPKFKFKPLDDSLAIEYAKAWLEAVKGKVFKANEEEINHFRKMVKFPEGEVIVEEPQQQGGIDPITGKPLPPKEMSENENESEVGAEENEESSKEDKKDAQKSDQKKQTFGKVFDQVTGDYHKKVNFKAIETKLNDYDQSLIADSQPLIKKIYNDLYDQIQKKKIVSDKKVERIDSLKLKNLSELKKILKNSLLSLYKDAQSQASQEIFKSQYRAPTTSEEFLKILEEETFSYIGDWNYQVLKKVKAELIAAIKDGRPLSDALDVLDDEGKKLSEQSLERFARTKHTEVLNRGRHDFFEKSGVISGYQYSAILDDRTSEICRGLHGKKFKAGDEPIPPMHFNCRSVLIPITKYEEFDPSETVGKVPIQQFIDENVGTGFSVK